jgi:hypothetical protein
VVFVHQKYQSLQWQTVCTTYKLLVPNNAYAAMQGGVLNFLVEHMCQPTLAILVQSHWSFSLEFAIFCKSLYDEIKSYNLYPTDPQTAPRINSGAKELLKTGL